MNCSSDLFPFEALCMHLFSSDLGVWPQLRPQSAFKEFKARHPNCLTKLRCGEGGVPVYPWRAPALQLVRTGSSSGVKDIVGYAY